jgi:hypothetical protein
MRASRFFVLALLLIAISPGIALAGDVVVDGETKDFYSDDVIDNLTVINGGAALLWGTTVDGNIMVQGENSYLGLGSASVGGNVCLKDQGRASIGWSTISGNLQGDASGHINFAISEVVGNIQIAEGADFSAPYGPCKVGGDIKYEKASAVRLNWFTVGGNVQVSENVSPSQYFGIEIRNCKIDGDLQVFKNTMTAFIKVENNTVGGNLQVKENTPEPTVSGNDVEGNVELD